MGKKKYEVEDFTNFTNRELAEAFVFPAAKPSTPKEKQEEEIFGFNEGNNIWKPYARAKGSR